MARLAPEAPPARSLRWGRAGILALVAIVVCSLARLLPPYLTLDPARSVVTLNRSFPAHYAVLITHIATGTVALVTVCVQVWPGLVRTRPAVHRISGRLYVFAGALPSSALVLLLVALMPEWRADIGTTLHGVLWFATTVAGYLAGRRGDWAAHRRWVLYSFALALGILWGVAARQVFPLLPFPVSIDYLFETARWFGWVVNLVLVQWWLERTAGDAPARG